MTNGFLRPAPTPDVVVRFAHLYHLTGWHGLYEHAINGDPRPAHGYTVDDNARALVVISREPHPDADLVRYRDRYLRFVLAGRLRGGWRNRMSHRGVWQDGAGSHDAHGRALWGLGSILGALQEPDRSEVTAALVAGTDLDSPSTRANAYAVLGLAAAAAGVAAEERYLLLCALERFAGRIPGPLRGDWAWPDARLAYANARLPEALIAAGVALDDGAMTQRGTAMLAWLVDRERGGHGFSFTPVGGRGPDDAGPAFDQQPIEAWAMADACARAAAATGDEAWLVHAEDAASWFLGRNDVGLRLIDVRTGGGFDGLHADRVNCNQGAESTLAALGALQTLRRIAGWRSDG